MFFFSISKINSTLKFPQRVNKHGKKTEAFFQYFARVKNRKIPKKKQTIRLKNEKLVLKITFNIG